MKFVLLLVSIPFISTVSCSPKPTLEDTFPTEFEVLHPLVRDTEDVTEYVANVQACKNVQIRTRVSGIIESLGADEGQTVKKDQILFTINNKQLQQDLVKAQAATRSVLAEMRAAEIELNGAKNLLEKNFISKPEFELAEARLKTLQAKLQEARTDESQARLIISYTEIKAPFDGVLGRIPKKTGNFVEKGDELTTLNSSDEVFAYFRVSEKEYLDYALIQKGGESREVSLILANGQKYAHTGVIETTDSSFDTSTGTIAFRARFPNPDRILKHGATGKVRLKTPIKNAVLIPQKSTFDRQESLFVFVVDEEGAVQARQVVIHRRMPQFLVIGEGLAPNDRILYEGVQRVREGDRIVTRLIPFPETTN